MTHGFVPPMLAAPLPERLDVKLDEWAYEEKFDGHRLIVAVNEGSRVKAWSRNEIERVLPPHVRVGLGDLPAGVYDGELLVPGARSYGVTQLTNSSLLVYTIFDVIALLEVDTTPFPYDARRGYLEEVFKTPRPGLALAQSHEVACYADIETALQDVWARDGEGLIVKRRTGLYRPGKRSKDWLKIKQLRSAVVTVTGFEAGLNGPCAIMLLLDDEGNETRVKTLNDEWLARFERSPQDFVNRRLRIEFHERTPDGGYRHPRADRWEDE